MNKIIKVAEITKKTGYFAGRRWNILYSMVMVDGENKILAKFTKDHFFTGLENIFNHEKIDVLEQQHPYRKITRIDDERYLLYPPPIIPTVKKKDEAVS